MKEELKKINDIFDEYEEFLYYNDPLFLNNCAFFYKLFSDLHKYIVKIDNCNYSLSSATNTLKLAREFYERYYPNVLPELEKIFNGGNLDIFYRNEDVEECDNPLYDRKQLAFYERINQDNVIDINIPLTGSIKDGLGFVHEIRHYLNEPINQKRSIFNDFITEGLSIFDEILFSEYIYDKYDNNELINFELDLINHYIKDSNYICFICKCLNIKSKLGVINEENYNFIFEDGYDYFEKNCLYFLEQTNSINSIMAHRLYWYTFGIMLTSYIYEQYNDDHNFLDNYIKLNEEIKMNKAEEALLSINLDLNDDNVIEKLKNSFTNFIKHYSKNIEKGKSK